MLLIAFGTRPEWIKVRPIVDEIHGKIPYQLLYTGQHTDLVDLKGYRPKCITVSPYLASNRLDSIVCSILGHLDGDLKDITHVMVQGDTTTAFAVALAAFHRQIKVIHLEAGLRTYSNTPYPEEFNRRAISLIAELHLCPTQESKENCLSERVRGEIRVVGNTVLDSIHPVKKEKTKVLCTMHRRENIPLIPEWFAEINKLAQSNLDIEFVFPMHPNPEIQKHKHLLPYVNVVAPMSRDQLIETMCESHLVITDSGGLQEEAAFLRVPCVVCRISTERPEGLGNFSLLCRTPGSLGSTVISAQELKMEGECPYGDGNVSKKILEILEKLI